MYFTDAGSFADEVFQGLAGSSLLESCHNLAFESVRF